MAYKNNKDIPTRVFTIVEPYLHKKSSLFYRAQSNGEFLVKLIDSDPTSDFFFQITDFNVDTMSSITFNIVTKPKSALFVTENKINIQSSQLETHFTEWHSNIEFYTQKGIDIFNPDFIIKQYEEEFLSEFEILDDDADTKPYNYPTQVKIERFLEEVITKLEEDKNEENRKEIEEIQKDVIELKNTQTQLTKRVFIKRLSNIYAKMRKHSFSFAKYIFELVVEKFADAVVKRLINSE